MATVMPEIGFDDEPISPVSRDDTVTNRKPKKRIMSAPANPPGVNPRPSWGRAMRATIMPRLPPRTTVIGRSRSVRGTLPVPVPSFAPRRSRTPPRTAPKMTGRACTMLKIPPAATAPAPMYRMYFDRIAPTPMFLISPRSVPWMAAPVTAASSTGTVTVVVAGASGNARFSPK